MAYRYEFTFDRHSELSNDTVRNIKCYLENLTDGKIIWNKWRVPDEMALYNLEQTEDREDEVIPLESRGEPIRTTPLPAASIRISDRTLDEIQRAFELQRPSDSPFNSMSVGETTL